MLKPEFRWFIILDMGYVRKLTEDEYDEIMDALYHPQSMDLNLYKRTKIWCILALESQAGLRLKTACNLRKDDIRYEEANKSYYIMEYLPKSQTYKKLDIPKHIVKVVLFISATHKAEGPLFEGYKGSDGRPRPITERAVKKMLKKVTEDLEIDGVSTRSFYKYYYNGPAEEDDED